MSSFLSIIWYYFTTGIVSENCFIIHKDSLSRGIHCKRSNCTNSNNNNTNIIVIVKFVMCSARKSWFRGAVERTECRVCVVCNKQRLLCTLRLISYGMHQCILYIGPLTGCTSSVNNIKAICTGSEHYLLVLRLLLNICCEVFQKFRCLTLAYNLDYRRRNPSSGTHYNNNYILHGNGKKRRHLWKFCSQRLDWYNDSSWLSWLNELRFNVPLDMK